MTSNIFLDLVDPDLNLSFTITISSAIHLIELSEDLGRQ